MLPRSPPPPAPHLRVLHDLRADGECAEPLLQLRAQPGARHDVVLPRERRKEAPGASAAGSPGPGRGGAGRDGAGRPAGGLAASVPLSLLVSARRRWRQPCRTCGAPYPAPRRSEAPSCSSPSLAPRLVPGSSISAMKGESELATTFSVGNVGGGFRKYLTSENPWAEDGSRAPRRFPRPSELRPSHRVGPGSRLKEAAFRED